MDGSCFRYGKDYYYPVCTLVAVRITKRRLKGLVGEIGVVPESLDDLWHLKYIIEAGDLVFSLTKRSVEGASDKLRPEKSEKRTMRLGVLVEGVEFHRFSNRLRIHGIIESGLDRGSYHTLNIEGGTELSIVKAWRRDQIERIKEALKESNRPRVVIVTIEEGEAVIGILRQFTVEEFSDLRGSLGKGEGNYRGEFFSEVVKRLSGVGEEADALLIAGPGFTKEDFLDVLKSRMPAIAEKSVLVDTASIGIQGFQEVLRRGVVERITASARLTRETLLMEELLTKISTNGPVAYGWDEVRFAFEVGAIKTLLITDEYLHVKREEESGEEIDRFLRRVEEERGRIVIFSTEFEPGKRLEGLGGVAALLRFKIER